MRVEKIERAVPFTKRVEVRRRRGDAPTILAQGLHRHQLLGIVVRQRAQQHGVDDAEHHRVGADANREREHGDRREPRRAAHQTRAAAQILEGHVEPRQARAIAIAFLRLFDPAEAPEGPPACLVARHPGADVVVDVQLQVAFELVRELALAPVTSEKTEQPHARGANLSHDDCSPVARNRARISLARSQSRVSRSTCLRPARVNR